MNVPTMQRAAVYSFVAHVVFLMLAIVLSRSVPKSRPATYIVKLVDKSIEKTAHHVQKVVPKKQVTPQKPQHRQKVVPKPPRPENRPRMAPKKELAPAPKPAGPSIEDRIRALQKKKQQEEQTQARVKREKELRESLERIRQSVEQKNAAVQEATNQAEYNRLVSEYTSTLTDIFESNWTYPDIEGVYRMSARMLITVYPDGRVSINKILKPSGNRVFDRSILKAMNDAGRVPPPPYGKTVEIEVEFQPEKP